jgi:hypothetical protein
MPVTQEELDSFHRFASQKLNDESADLSWDELFIHWQSARERDEVNTAIREGLADVEAGRYQDASDAMEEIRKEFDFPK